MQQVSGFQVYNASAGSGKTFTLVKEYLKVLLCSQDAFYFQKVLAITFTNKAAEEMKTRILHNLRQFSEAKQNEVLQCIADETSLDIPLIEQRSKRILTAILENYTAFSITTIDSFTHKIIRSFARDLGLSLNFEVEMDSNLLLREAVELMMSKIGIDQRLTELLIRFSIDKIDEDKSWDISKEFNEFSKIILNENDATHFKKLANKELDTFAQLYTRLKQQQKFILTELQKIGEKGLVIINSTNLQHNDFYLTNLPKHFISLVDKAEDTKFFDNGKLREQINNHVFYAKKKSAEIKATIEGILPELLDLYEKSEGYYQQFLLYQLTLKSIVPLAVLNHINTALTTLKKENNIQLHSEFNRLIAQAIKDQPAPFIYERIGQKFMHYCIDEMQDTSVLQWQNLVPLIANALSQENSSLLLVGDGKQAIYRWRGSKAEQFINLSSRDGNTTNPFPIAKQVKTLPINYRSFSNIIDFNNAFFQHISQFLQNETHRQLFIDGNKQLTNTKKGGLVSLSFLEKQDDEEQEKIKYPKKVLEIIKKVSKSNFTLGDICVLVRRKKDGVAIANYLSENGIPIVSAETLLLKNSLKVNFIINLLQIIHQPNDKEVLFEVLYFLHTHLQLTTNKHTFINSQIHLFNNLIFKNLEAYGILFELTSFFSLSFYDKVEEIIRSFQLTKISDAYLQYFLDVVFEQQQKGTDLENFLDFWEAKKEGLSIIAPESSDAVKVMTIHKAKGLEFPVVIFPYDLYLYRQINPKVWLDDLPATSFGDFEEMLVPFEKKLQHVNDSGTTLYQERLATLELDKFNLLYVALTRAVAQLYIVMEKRVNKKGEENCTYYSGLFIHYLKAKGLWNEDVLDYYPFGNAESKTPPPKRKKRLAAMPQGLVSTSWKTHNIYILTNASKLWDTHREEAVAFGNLIHEMMAKIITKNDVQQVINQYVNQGIIGKIQALSVEKSILELVTHPQLASLYSTEVTAFNEREILTKKNEIIIPDRLVFNHRNEVVIIDYKTGKPSQKYRTQIQNYEQALGAMNFKVTQKMLVYINNHIVVEMV